MHLAVGHDVINQIAIRCGNRLIHKHEHPWEFVRLLEAEQISNGVVPGREDFSREQDAVGVLKPDYFF
jgi:hypothetical protein